jgi:hypothetical protein
MDGVRLAIHAPADSPLHAWLPTLARAATDDGADVIVVTPELIEQTRAHRRRIACLPLARVYDLVAPDAFERVALRADAYATTEQGLRDALTWSLRDDAAQRTSGALRLTYLGTLGSVEPVDAGPIGRAFPIGGRLVVGRGSDCDVVLRTGAHSDQNTVARKHALLEHTPEGVVVRCLGGTNGTWLDGARVTSSVVPAGAELAFACTHRFRLDGAATS